MREFESLPPDFPGGANRGWPCDELKWQPTQQQLGRFKLSLLREWTGWRVLGPAIAGSLVIAIAACGGDDGDDGSPTTTSAPAATEVPAPTATPEPTATPIPDAPEPDIANGEALFTAQGCSSCHSTGTDTIVGPGLSGLSERAGSRVAGKSAVEYVTQSIRSPNAFVVPDFFPDLMPTTFSTSMTETEIADVVAYLLQLP